MFNRNKNIYVNGKLQEFLKNVKTIRDPYSDLDLSIHTGPQKPNPSGDQSL